MKSASPRDHRRHWGSTVVKVLQFFVSDCVERPPWMNMVVVFSTGFERLRLFRFFRKRRLCQMLRERLLGRQGGSGRASGGVQEGSRRRLGEPKGCPRGSGGHLGRVLGALGAILERPLAQSDFGSIFGSIWSAKRVPKGRHLRRPKGAKIDPKTIPKRR